MTRLFIIHFNALYIFSVTLLLFSYYLLRKRLSDVVSYEKLSVYERYLIKREMEK